MKRHSILHLAQVVPALLTLFLLLVSSLHAQKKGSSNTSISLATSFNDLEFYVAPPIGIIGELGLREWGTIGVYGAYGRLKYSRQSWAAGGRITLQLRGIAEGILETPLNTLGIKPYIGIAGGWIGIGDQGGDLYNQFSYSPVFGLRYYPIDRWGLMIEWGETFSGATGLIMGVSYGGRK